MSKIVRLYLDLQEDVAKKQFKKKYESICTAVEQSGENISFLKGIVYLMFYFNFNYHPRDVLALHSQIETDVDYRQLLALWKKSYIRRSNYKF